jgi:hypothetical protein
MQFGEKILLQRWTKERGERKRREWGEDPEGGGGRRRRGVGGEGEGDGTAEGGELI